MRRGFIVFVTLLWLIPLLAFAYIGSTTGVMVSLVAATLTAGGLLLLRRM
jgi:hypothetical protein